MSVRKLRKGTYQATTHLAVVVLVVILFVLVGYFFVASQDDDPGHNSERFLQLQASRDLWSSRRPPAFRYVVDRDCDCPPDIQEPYIATETAEGATAIFAEHIRSKLGDAAIVPGQPMWIDDAFTLIEAALHDDVEIEVRYDYAMGYPTAIRIAGLPGAAGRDERIEIRDFETLAYGRP